METFDNFQDMENDNFQFDSYVKKIQFHPIHYLYTLVVITALIIMLFSMTGYILPRECLQSEWVQNLIYPIPAIGEAIINAIAVNISTLPKDFSILSTPSMSTITTVRRLATVPKERSFEWESEISYL